ncbi:hypothetical protein DFH06DRAFT_1335422 [Mycena polygramma]|nr:hypothetical protein DFH06DRAFT_1335422 [Mycena polygramma]
MALDTPPTADERAALAADRERVTALNAHILELEASMKSLKAERKMAQARLDAYRYPVSTLPNEIVSEIFIHFLPVYPKCPPQTGRLSPYLLCRICRKWRNIAFATPALWRAIAITWDDIQGFEQKYDLLKNWLKLSGSCLLSIKLSGDLDDLGGPRRRHFLRTVADHRVRWEHLSSPRLHEIIPEITSPAFPCLRSLKVVEEEYEPTAPSFLAAPLLRKVALPMYLDAYTPIFPWSQLTVLSVGRIESTQCAVVLKLVVNINYCHLCIIGDDDFASLQNVTLPYLDTLILDSAFELYHFNGFLQSRSQGSLLDKLNLPALRRLKVSQDMLDSEDPIATVVQLATKSARNLRTLCVPGAQFPYLYEQALPSVALLILPRGGKLDTTDPFLEESGGESSDGDESMSATDSEVEGDSYDSD